MAKKAVATAQRNSGDVAFITPSVLRWALDSSALSRAAIAAKLKVPEDRLAEWENDPDTPPPFAKAQALAGLLHVPFGYLFLSKPPETALPLPDFRSLGRDYRPTPEFLEVLNDVLVKQDWYRDFLR